MAVPQRDQHGEFSRSVANVGGSGVSGSVGQHDHAIEERVAGGIGQYTIRRTKMSTLSVMIELEPSLLAKVDGFVQAQMFRSRKDVVEAAVREKI